MEGGETAGDVLVRLEDVVAWVVYGAVRGRRSR